MNRDFTARSDDPLGSN